MEFLIVVLLIVLIVMSSKRSGITTRDYNQLVELVERLTKNTTELRDEIRKLRAGSESELIKPAVPFQQAPDPVKPPEQKPPPPVIEPEYIPVEVKQPYIEKAAVTQVNPAPVWEPKPVIEEPSEGWWSRWMRNNPDLEKFIGENLINKVGIAVLVLGIAYFVKYAIDQEWINEVGRVSIGILSGGILIGLAHYIRKSYRSFSSVLAGGGIAVFYFTIAFAFHQYQLISQTAAFIIMVIITIFAVALSVLYNRIELAVIAAVGGFLTPLMVSTGSGNYAVLFSYLIILNTGLLLLAYFKRWPLVNVLSLLFTFLIVSGWLLETLLSGGRGVSYSIALFFIATLYLVFLAMNMIYQVKHKTSFGKFDFSVLVFLNAIFYAAGMALLAEVQNGQFQGLFTLVVGIINFVLAYYFVKRKDVDRNLLYLLIGLTLTFASLTIPVQLEGHAITMFWSAEMVLLYWLFLRSGISLFKQSSALIAILSGVSLLMDWSYTENESASALALIFTGARGIITNVIVVIAFAAYWILIRKDKGSSFLGILSNRLTSLIAMTMSLLLLYVTLIFSVNLYFSSLSTYEVPNVYYRIITYTFALVLMIVIKPATRNRLRLHVGLLIICAAWYLFSTGMIDQLRSGTASGNISMAHLGMHWFSDLLLIAVVVTMIRTLRAGHQHLPRFRTAFSSGIVLFLVIFISIEAFHVYLTGTSPAQQGRYESNYFKAGLTILWGICSFMVMWTGMKFKNKSLRVLSLSLFTLSLVKLFFFDIRNISEGGKIAAFILLGVLLLTISFMYQRLKKILIDEAKI